MIYCVEDDSGIRDMMIYALNASGFEAVGFGNSQDFFEALSKKKPELVMLDIMLPGEDGISILKHLRSQTATGDIPVIMASAKGTEFDKVIGLDLGADDYLAKPFGMMEMVSRVKAVLRRSAPKNQKKQLTVGALKLNQNEHTVIAEDIRIRLTLKEYDLLKLFMSNLGQVFSRDQLLSKIWGDDNFYETRTVDVHIGTLRTKLGVYGHYIETIRGVGYRMEEKV